ncbi:flagellar biosynthetic protein FliO [Halomonas binhaiensis]|uniref:Flagellar protein n=1 Tax=Halomonas binhaiensis TaxID=2562282 RepID=A0A5C1NJC3_9GAMM|nr:flagellar biosynthetic protein FliO [Halomonas binhaiensis]QEM83822.1 flagellar biosynthetic protein FliO [Halomonas binhaiensis]
MTASSITLDSAQETTTQTLATLGGNDLSGLAMLSKTAFSLAVVVVLILTLAALLRRRNRSCQGTGARLRIVGSLPVGAKEKVVVMEVQDRWLVLGVGGSQITLLDTLEAQQETSSAEAGNPDVHSGRFQEYLARRCVAPLRSKDRAQ